jgi:hypothetical protein
MGRAAKDSSAPVPTTETLVVEGTTVRAFTPEGPEATLPLPDFLGRLSPPVPDTGDLVMPDGTALVRTRGACTVLVHQTPPAVCKLQWIADGSPAQFGAGTVYRDVTIALPYLLVLAVFENGELSGASECFFRNAPVTSPDDELHYPALLNCSKFTPREGRPLSWICTQKLDRSRIVGTGRNTRIRSGLKALLHCLLETGFNYSSEHHEGSSWFTESRGVDPRVASIEAWEQATSVSPLFVLDVPWLKTGYSVARLVERIFSQRPPAVQPPPLSTAGDLARLVFNGRPAPPPPPSGVGMPGPYDDAPF